MFEHFISLGSSCFTASSMSKYGLRDCSGPFDWLITNSLQWVLHYIENDFEDFLDRQNLERWNGSSTQFEDKNSHFLFFHDGDYPFERRYDDLKAKYDRKIIRFQKNVKHPSCFLRLCMDEAEINYIIEHAEYIERVVKKKHTENEIIFLIKNDIVIPKPFPFRYYVISARSAGRDPSHEGLRNAFDEAESFLTFCAEHYNAVSMMENIIFDSQKEADYRKSLQQDQGRYYTLCSLVNCDFHKIQIPCPVIIYGAGNIGRYFYSRIKGMCEVRCFADKEKQGEIDGIPIKRLSEICLDGEETFVVTTTYDIENVREEIKEYCNYEKIISLDTLIEQSKI